MRPAVNEQKTTHREAAEGRGRGGIRKEIYGMRRTRPADHRFVVFVDEEGTGDTFKFRPSRCTHDPVSDVFQANSIGSLFFFRSPSFRTPRRAGSKKRINVGRGEGSHVGGI